MNNHKLNYIKHVDKPWGWEKWIVNKKEYCGKILFLKTGKKSSWHYHKLKDEVFYLQSGLVIIKYGEEEDINKCNQIILNPGESFHIPTGLKHRIIAMQDSELFEFSTQHFDTDSYRILQGE